MVRYHWLCDCRAVVCDPCFEKYVLEWDKDRCLLCRKLTNYKDGRKFVDNATRLERAAALKTHNTRSSRRRDRRSKRQKTHEYETLGGWDG